MSQTSAQRRARELHRLELWLPEEYVRKLDAICDDSGYGRGEQIMGMIDAETAEWEAMTRREKLPVPPRFTWPRRRRGW